MTTISSYRNAGHALLESLCELKSHGTKVEVRGMKTTEILGHSFTVSDPTARFTLIPFRKCNPFAQIAETFWMLSGRDDLDWLEFYIPQCKRWSDDGKTWRDAYGPRLRKYNQQYELSGGVKYPVGDSVDQIEEAVLRLSEDIHSRQVILTIWNPSVDWVTGSKAYPCNIVLQFMVRNNQLHMFVYVRSNDVIYGFSHNDFFSWSVLHQLMAHWVGVDIGALHWNAASFHIYERHYELAQKIIYATHPRQYVYDYDIPRVPVDVDFYSFDEKLTQMFVQETQIRSGLQLDALYEPVNNTLMDISTKMLMLYTAYKCDHISCTDLIHAIELIPYSDFRIAAIDYFCRDDRFSLQDFTYLLPDDGVYNYLNAIYRYNCK